RFVKQPGEFARRGGILDVFPYTGEYPIRMEFFGDEVDSIREFDPDSQRSISFLETIRLVPDASNLSTGQKQSLLSYLDEYTVVLLMNESLITSEIEERFTEVGERFKSMDNQQNLPPHQQSY